ncbi:MAG: hypothetical protein AB1782_03660 [Cyanobacteriota bacterium]
MTNIAIPLTFKASTQCGSSCNKKELDEIKIATQNDILEINKPPEQYSTRDKNINEIWREIIQRRAKHTFSHVEGKRNALQLTSFVLDFSHECLHDLYSSFKYPESDPTAKMLKSLMTIVDRERKKTDLQLLEQRELPLARLHI